MDSFTTYSLRCSMNSIVFPPHTQLFGFWCFLHLHCRAKISSVVWIFYLLIFNSFEKKHYITKFPNFFQQFEKSNQWKHSKHAGTYFLVFSFSLVVSMVSCISKKCSIILSMVFPFCFSTVLIVCFNVFGLDDASQQKKPCKYTGKIHI